MNDDRAELQRIWNRAHEYGMSDPQEQATAAATALALLDDRELRMRSQFKMQDALIFYAALGPDEIPYADTINDPPDVGRVAREALGEQAMSDRLQS